MHLEVQAMRTLKLVLKTSYALDLKETFYVSSFCRNLVSIARLVFNNYGVLFENDTFSIFNNKSFVSGGALINGLYKIDLDPTFEYNYLAKRGNYDIKRSIINDNSSLLLRKRLRYISIDRIKR